MYKVIYFIKKVEVNMNRYKGIIYDMDGVLIDSEPIYKGIEEEMYKKLNFHPTQKEVASSMGRGCKNWWGDLKEWYHLDVDPQKMADLEMEQYMAILNGDPNKIPFLPNVKYSFERLSKQGIHLAIASGSARPLVQKVTELLNIDSIIDGFVSSEDVQNGKPYPEIMEKAAELMAVNCDDCLVIDDATGGLIAARRAGMNAFLFASAPSNMVDASLADEVVHSHREILKKILD